MTCREFSLNKSMKLFNTFKWNVGAMSLRCERHLWPRNLIGQWVNWMQSAIILSCGNEQKNEMKTRGNHLMPSFGLMSNILIIVSIIAIFVNFIKWFAIFSLIFTCSHKEYSWIHANIVNVQTLMRIFGRSNEFFSPWMPTSKYWFQNLCTHIMVVIFSATI